MNGRRIGLACMAAWVFAGGAGAGEEVVVPAERPSRVYEIAVSGTAYREAVDRLVAAVAGATDASRGWRMLLGEARRIGVMRAGFGPAVTPGYRAFAAAVGASMEAAGYGRSRVVTSAGARGRSAYDPKAPVTFPIQGRLIDGDVEFRGEREGFSITSHWSRFVSGGADRFVNLPTLCALEGMGVAGAIYGATVPHLDNARRLVQPPASGDPYLAELLGHDLVRERLAVHLMFAVEAQFAGGPGYEPNYAWRAGVLLGSTDPVALDAAASLRVEAWRKEARLPSGAGVAGYLRSASAMGLGEAEGVEVEALR